VVAGFDPETLSMDSWERIRSSASARRRRRRSGMLVEAEIIGTIGTVVGSVAGLVVGHLPGSPAGCRPRSGAVGDDRGPLIPRHRWRCWPP
jgi:hypothetical protein